LIEKNLIKTSDKRIYRDRLALDFFNTGEMILNEGQEKVYNEILDSIGQNDFTPFLLFGRKRKNRNIYPYNKTFNRER